jgi:hypothetical protein
MPDFVDLEMQRAIETFHSAESNIDVACAQWERLRFEAKKRYAAAELAVREQQPPSIGDGKTKQFWPILWRSVVTLGFAIALEWGVAVIFWPSMAGQDWKQKATAASCWHVLFLSAVGIFYRVILGKERWKRVKFWKDDDK